jgi:hypothetical protein
MNEQIIFEKALASFGADNQKIVAIEELAKDLRGKVNRENIIEEIADVEIMLAQLKIIYSRYFGNREFHSGLGMAEGYVALGIRQGKQ